MIEYEKLEVFQLSLGFVELSLSRIQGLPTGYAELNTQLKRAALSISLNIAEGAGKSMRYDKRRYYQSAKGSAMESAAICDILHRIKLIDAFTHAELKDLLKRITSMLSKLCSNLTLGHGRTGDGIVVKKNPVMGTRRDG